MYCHTFTENYLFHKIIKQWDVIFVIDADYSTFSLLLFVKYNWLTKAFGFLLLKLALGWKALYKCIIFHRVKSQTDHSSVPSKPAHFVPHSPAIVSIEFFKSIIVFTPVFRKLSYLGYIEFSEQIKNKYFIYLETENKHAWTDTIEAKFLLK